MINAFFMENCKNFAHALVTTILPFIYLINELVSLLNKFFIVNLSFRFLAQKFQHELPALVACKNFRHYNIVVNV